MPSAKVVPPCPVAEKNVRYPSSISRYSYIDIPSFATGLYQL